MLSPMQSLEAKRSHGDHTESSFFRGRADSTLKAENFLTETLEPALE